MNRRQLCLRSLENLEEATWSTLEEMAGCDEPDRLGNLADLLEDLDSGRRLVHDLLALQGGSITL